MSFILKNGDSFKISVSNNETDAVKIAVENLKSDLYKVINAKEGAGVTIIIGTLGVSKIISNYINADILKDENGKLRKEAFLITVKDDALVIAGSDRRGTIYGIYDFCESIGVSPWYFFADVPVKKKEIIKFKNGYTKTDYPTVEYRGIFINDEEELDRWVKLNMGEKTIGVKTYEKIFELLLRLKANYIWPAMHVNSFNIIKENGALADKMGIVVGTSHCDMLMRSNYREWEPWLKVKGYEDVQYDYSIPGKNREILKEYWRESIEQNKDFEVSYTLGMRGVHDSGFEVSALSDYTGDELVKKKIELLEQIMNDQDEMLADVLGHDTLKTFVPYKEVLNLYDAGLNVPEDFTLIWSNDNYGYIRRYPGDKEKARSGGNGIYYHNSYWAPPCASYLFICSIPLAHTKNELLKAYNEGIKKLWVLNVGAIKPIEPEMEFFIKYAWEIGKETTTADVDKYIEQWINKNFSGNFGAQVADIFNSFDALTNVRKVEFLDNNVFSLDAYGDEWSDRVNKYRALYDRANAVYYALPDAERDAFYELVLMKIHAGYYMNAQYYYADRSMRCNRRGMLKAAQQYTKLSLEYDDKKRQLIEYYNHILCGGKWNGILMPESFPPPVAAMHPICMPPVEIPQKSEPIVTLWNDEDEINFVRPSVKWIDIAPSGDEAIDFKISAPSWVSVSKTSGTVSVEERIFVSINKKLKNKRDNIEIKFSNNTVTVPIKADCSEGGNIEDGGIVTISADEKLAEGWNRIERLGRGCGAVMEAKDSGATVSYNINTVTKGAAVMEIHRFPSLNSTGKIRVGISVDGGDMITVESASNDEHRGTWKENILNNVDKLYLELPELSEDGHTISVTAIDKYFAFSKITVYAGGRKYINMGEAVYNAEIPQDNEDKFYNISLNPRPTVYASKDVPESTLDVSDTLVMTHHYGASVKKTDIVNLGNSAFREENGAIKIDAAAALKDTKFAKANNGSWSYCNSESYNRTGIAMYTTGGIVTNDKKNAPYLSYKINSRGGKYTVWALVKIPLNGGSYLTVGVDGKTVPLSKCTNGGNLWRYEAERIWRWVPVTEMRLSEGEHTFSIYSVTTGICIDRIYITKGSELPSADCIW